MVDLDMVEVVGRETGTPGFAALPTGRVPGRTATGRTAGSTFDTVAGRAFFPAAGGRGGAIEVDSGLTSLKSGSSSISSSKNQPVWQAFHETYLAV